MMRFFVLLQLFGLGNSFLNSDSNSLDDQNEYSASSASSLANASSSPDASKPGLPGRSLIRMLEDESSTAETEEVATGGSIVNKVWGLIKGVWGLIKGVWETVYGFFKGVWDTVWDYLLKFVTKKNKDS